MNPDDVRAWAAARKRAAERERQEAILNRPAPDEALRRSLDMRDALSAVERDPQEEADNLQFHLRWAEVRRVMGVR